MGTEECECVTKWKEEIKKKFNTKYISAIPVYNCGRIVYRKIITPKDPYGSDNEPRLSKYWLHAESKDFKFCPYCGKKLKEDSED